MNRRLTILPLCMAALLGCEAGGEAQALAEETRAAHAAGVQPCVLEGSSVGLPDEVRETSGLAQSRREPGIFWTHNDAGNGPELFGLDTAGQVVRRLTLDGVEAVDWEDIESGGCEGGDCLFVGDIGDNDADRERITIYRIAEPEAGGAAGEPITLHARYPDGPRDAESLFRLPDGDIYLVTKGREGPIELYRFPAPQQAGATATLERVRELFPQPQQEDDRVTAATASADGKWVGIRSYRNLYLYRAEQLTGAGAAEPLVVDLGPMRQAQGESVVIGADGVLWLTSEAENRESEPAWGRLRCTLPAD